MSHKIFDIHTDIIYDVYIAAKNNDFNRFESLHAKQLNQSVINAGVWTLYSPNDFDLLNAYKLALKHIDFNLVKDMQIILGLEGLRNLKDINELDSLYNLGVRHAMLTWNEENKYATGVFGNPLNGVTNEGYKVLDYMISRDMIIDLSHLNEKSFYDVVNYTNKNLIASHSNARSLCNHPRNLSDEQLILLKEKDALVGITSIGKFIKEVKEERSLSVMVDHIEHIVNIMGIDNVCLGFDFMDYFNQEVTSNLEDFKDATEAYKLIDLLEKRGFKKEQIEKITYSNFYNRFKHLIIK